MSAQPLDATIVITNFNGRRFLEPCLRALFAQTYLPAEIILVDNGSQDASVTFVRTRFPGVHIIEQGANTGFAAAVNAGIRASHTEIIVTLNNDTIAEPDWLYCLVAPFQNGHRIGMVASKMLFVEPLGMINSAGICVDRVGIAWDRMGGLPDSNDQQVVEVFGACAGAAAYRRALFDDIGLFDDDFFIYLEDVDLAWRAQLAGWRALYAPCARVQHWHSGTSIEGSPLKSRLLGRNKVWLIAKNYPAPQLWYYLPLIVAYDIAALVYAAIARRDLYALRGRLDGVLSLPAALRKRRQIQAARRVSGSINTGCLEPIATFRDVRRRYQHLQSAVILRPSSVGTPSQ